VYTLWNGSYVANPAGFYHANHTYMAPYQPTYKSEIVNQWEQHGIAYVSKPIVIVYLIFESQLVSASKRWENNDLPMRWNISEVTNWIF